MRLLQLTTAAAACITQADVQAQQEDAVDRQQALTKIQQEIFKARDHWWADRELQGVEDRIQQEGVSDDLQNDVDYLLRDARMKSAIRSLQQLYSRIVKEDWGLECDTLRALHQRTFMIHDPSDRKKFQHLVRSVIQDIKE